MGKGGKKGDEGGKKGQWRWGGGYLFFFRLVVERWDNCRGIQVAHLVKSGNGRENEPMETFLTSNLGEQLSGRTRCDST